MSEMEELKKNTEMAKVAQQFTELSQYIEKLGGAIDEALRRRKTSSRIYILTWLAWVIAGLFNHLLGDLFESVFILALIYDAYRFAILRSAFGEFRGAMEVLRILGMLPPRPDPREKKKRAIFSEGIEMVKRWASSKKKAQEEVYAPV